MYCTYTLHAGYGLLNPNSRPILSPRGRELERGQQAARLVLGRLRCLERLLQFGECPLPNPPPRGREQIAAGSGVVGLLKKNTRNINSRDFQVAFIARQMEQTPRAFFQTGFEPIGRVCAARHAPYMRATACYTVANQFQTTPNRLGCRTQRF